MRQKRSQLVVSFFTTDAAMALEKHCRQEGLPGRLFPVPRSLTADCGIAWRCETALERELLELIGRYGIEVSGVQRMEL